MKQFYNNNIFDDFLYHVFGFVTDDKFTVDFKRENISLPAFVVEYKRLLNNIVIDECLLKSLEHLLCQYASRKLVSCRSIATLSVDKRCEIIDISRDSNRDIAKTYLGRANGELFYNKEPVKDESGDVEILSHEQISDITDFIKQNDSNLFLSLINAILVASLSDDNRQVEVANIFYQAKQLNPEVFPSVNGSIKTFYLHVGMHKTATSSIQDTLYANRDRLEEKDTFYSPSWIANHSLSMLQIFTSEYLQKIRKFQAKPTKDVLLENQRKKIDELTSDLSSSNAQVAIISAECLGHFSRLSLSKLFNLLKFINNGEIKIICSVRSNIAYRESAYNERNKIIVDGYVGLDSVLAEGQDIYKVRLQRLIAVFGKDNLIVYKFEDAIKYPGGPVGKFLDVIGISDLISKSEFKKTNTSVSDKSLSLITYISKSNVINPDNVHMIKLDIKYLHKIRGEKFRFSAKDIKKIIEQDRDSIMWLCDEFELDYTESFHDIFQDPSPMVFGEAYEEDIKRIYAKLSLLVQKMVYQYICDQQACCSDEISQLHLENLKVWIAEHFPKILHMDVADILNTPEKYCRSVELVRLAGEENVSVLNFRSRISSFLAKYISLKAYNKCLPATLSFKPKWRITQHKSAEIKIDASGNEEDELI